MLAHATAVTDSSFAHEVEQSNGLTIVDFSATWCPPCRVVEPMLDALAAERPDVKVVAIDTDENLETAVRFNIRSVPTVLFFKNGQLVERIVGIAPRARIDAMIDKHL